MGQYYYPIIFCYEEGKVKILAWLYSHAYGNGLKLMEHSYVGNILVTAVESLLIPGGAFHNQRLVWAGDYADKEPNGKKLQELCKKSDCLSPAPLDNHAEYPYIVNHSKHQYVRKPAMSDYTIHPLPILTAEGNGRGGGDYNGSDMHKVGMWARDIISIEKEPPVDYVELMDLALPEPSLLTHIRIRNKGTSMGQYFLPIIVCYRNGKMQILACVSPYSYQIGVKLMEHSYIGNEFVTAVESLLIPGGAFYNQRLVWAGDYADNEPSGQNLYAVVSDMKCCYQPKPLANHTEYPYIVNHSKHQYVRKPAMSDLTIHPLPILTAEGNGRGNGDYNGSDMHKVGMWARDIISIEKEPPVDYVEQIVNF